MPLSPRFLRFLTLQKFLTSIRPVSVTSHLSRIAEKIMVRNWLLPFIPARTLLDQFAFKPTGSNTAALIHFTHHIIS